MTTLRDASWEDFDRFTGLSREGKELLWGVVAEEDGEPVGHAFLSMNQGFAWAHDLAHWGHDGNTVARMFLRGWHWAKENGHSAIYTDVLPGEGTEQMYRSLGWTVERLIMKGEIK